MTDLATLILTAGRSGVELALFILLPVMVVMLTLMRLLEARGILDGMVRLVAPLLKPFGLPGLGVFAMIQVLLVSFAAPVATLAIMDRSGTSRRHLAATLAMVLGMAQANVVFPMAAVGLNAGTTLLISLVAGLLGAALTYYLFGRHLSTEEGAEPALRHARADGAKGILEVVNRAGREAFEIAISAIPMLILALVAVHGLRASGLIDSLEISLAPLFDLLGLPSALLLPIISKYIAGGTAMMGVTVDYLNQGLLTPEALNRMAGFLIHPLDIVGVAVLISAGRRVASVVKPALLGGLTAILVRSLLHVWLL